MRIAGLFLFMVSLLFPSDAAYGDAAKKVKQGIAHFHAQDFKKAANAFTEADVAKPDNDLITYDRACAYAAQDDIEKAAELFRAAALSRDTRLAGRCHYNLGGLAAGQARAVFGEKPEEATPEVRAEGLQLLQMAVGHYRDCIELAPDHAEARHNLELIRLWIKQMEDVWRQRDRQKQRDEMNLLAFLQMLEAQQRMLRATARSLADQPDSPQRRQAFSVTSSAQRELSQEIEPLKEKITAAMQPAQPSGAPPPDESMVKVISLLTHLADDVGQAMQNAADNLDGESVDDAVGLQADAVAGLDQIYMAVVPFPGMVTRGVATQEELINRVAPAMESGGEAVDEEVEDDETVDDANRPELDAPEAAWDQRFVAGWGGILPGKAEHGMKNLDAIDPAAMAGVAGQNSQQPAPDPAAAQKQQEQLDQLKTAMEKAVELGPQIYALAQDASGHLEKEELADALPKQEEALKLWKEIADLLPKQNPQEQCKNPSQDENQDDQQDQEQSDDSQQQQPQPQPSPQDISKQQAESVLRKARDQEKKRRHLEKEVQKYLFRAHAVERDW
jgi:hypothetical protein